MGQPLGDINGLLTAVFVQMDAGNPAGQPLFFHPIIFAMPY
jgi:hypothetical protein